MPKSDSTSPKKSTKTVKAKASSDATLDNMDKPIAKRKPTAKPINDTSATSTSEKAPKAPAKVKKVSTKTTKSPSKAESAATASLAKKEKLSTKKVVKDTQVSTPQKVKSASVADDKTSIREVSMPLGAKPNAPIKEIKTVIEKTNVDQSKGPVLRISTPPRQQHQSHHENRSQKEFSPQRDYNRDRKQSSQHSQNQYRSSVDTETGFALPETVGGELKRNNNKRRRNRNKPRQDQPYATDTPAPSQVDGKELARKAWKIFLGEITEDGLALMDDHSTKEVAAKAFRVAELFLMEKAHRARRKQSNQQRNNQEQDKQAPINLPETKINLIPDSEELEESDELIYDIDRDEDAFNKDITEVQAIFASDDEQEFISDDELDV